MTREAYAAFLVGEGVATSAIEGEKLSVNAVRSSVARHLGLPSAGLPIPTRSVDGLVDVAIAGYGFYTSFAGRPLFGESLLQE